MAGCVEALTRFHATPLRSQSLSTPENTGFAQPVRFTCNPCRPPPRARRRRARRLRAAALAPRATLERVGDRGAARAGAGGERLPHPALEDPAPRTSPFVGLELCVPRHVVRLGKRVSDSIGGRVRQLERGELPGEPTRIAHWGCRSSAAPTRARPRTFSAGAVLAAVGIVARAERRRAHVDAGVRPGDQRGDAPRGGGDREALLVGPAVVFEVQDRSARAVARTARPLSRRD